MEPIKCLSQIMVYRITNCSIKAIDSVLDHLEKFAKKPKTSEQADAMEGETDESETRMETCNTASIQSTTQPIGVSEPQLQQKLPKRDMKHDQKRGRKRGKCRKDKISKSNPTQGIERIERRLRSRTVSSDQPIKGHKCIPIEIDAWASSSTDGGVTQSSTMPTNYSDVTISDNTVTKYNRKMAIGFKARSGMQWSDVVAGEKRMHTEINTISASPSKGNVNVQKDCQPSKVKRLKGIEIDSHTSTEKDRFVKSQIIHSGAKNRRAKTSSIDGATDVGYALVKGRSKHCNESVQEQKQVSSNIVLAKVNRQKGKMKKNTVHHSKAKRVDKSAINKKERFTRDQKLVSMFKRRYSKRIEQNIHNDADIDRNRNKIEEIQPEAADSQANLSPRQGGSGSRTNDLVEGDNMILLGVDNSQQISKSKVTESKKNTKNATKTVTRKLKQVDKRDFSYQKNPQLYSELPALINSTKHQRAESPMRGVDNYQNIKFHPMIAVTGNVSNDTVLTANPEFKQGTRKIFSSVSVNAIPAQFSSSKNRHMSGITKPNAQITRKKKTGNASNRHHSEHSLFTNSSTGEPEELEPISFENRHSETPFNTTESQDIPKKVSSTYRALLRKDYQKLNTSTSTSSSDEYHMINPFEYHQTRINQYYDVITSSQTTQTDSREFTKERPTKNIIYPRTAQYILLPVPANNEQQTVSLINGVVQTLTPQHDELDNEFQ